MTTLTRNAPAKINLTLDVGRRRPDGYHDIRSIMQTLALHDTLTVALAPEAPGIRLDVTGEEAAGVPGDASNIVHKAAVRLQKVAAARCILPGNRSGLHLTLHKRIPSQAGLGGGSSDAAAALLALNELLGLGLAQARLTEIGASLGADVPFFLAGGTALAEGLGELVTPLPPLAPDWPLVIVKPTVGVSTPAAYAALDALPDRQPGTATEHWLRGNQQAQNDFEAMVLPAYPEVAAAYSLLSSVASSLVSSTAGNGKSFTPRLCGSGSALFLRTSDEAAADQVAVQVRAAGLGKVWVTQTVEAGEREKR